MAEQRANFKSDCQGDPAASVITETLLTAHLASTLRYIPQTVVLSEDPPPRPPNSSTQNRSTVSAKTGLSADERK